MTWEDDLIARRWPDEQRGLEMMGTALKRRRVRLNLTQMDLERMTGIDQTVISRIERARRWGISWRRFALLVSVLGGLDFDPPPPKSVPGWERQTWTPNPYLAREAAKRDALREGVPIEWFEQPPERLTPVDPIAI